MKYLCKPKQTTNKAKKKQINESKIRVNKQCACVSLYCICNVQGECERGGGNPFIGKQMRFWQRTRVNLVKIIKHELQESSKVRDARSFRPYSAISAWPGITCTGCCPFSSLPPCPVQLPFNIEITFYAAHCAYGMLAFHAVCVVQWELSLLRGKQI